MKGFTDAAVQKLKPRENKFTVTEGNGLYLQVSPKGKKTWLHRYEIGGKRKWHQLGEYPGMSLKAAREENEKISKVVARGECPADKAGLTGNSTVKDVYEEWFAKGADKKGRAWSDAYRRNVHYMFELDVLPKIGARKIRDITKRDIRTVLEKVEERAPHQALNVYRRLSRLFNHAASRDIIEVSPMAALDPIGSTSKKDRYLTADEIKILLISLPDSDMAPNTAAALELILRTGQRPSEVIGARKDEMQGDWWILPGERTKNGIEHRVPLTRAMKALFGEANEHGFFFPSLRNPEQPISHVVLSKAVRRSVSGAEKTQRDKTPSIPITPFSPHDLRRTCATGLAELGFTDEIIGAILNHKKVGVIAHYNVFRYDQEKKRALLAWERRLDEIITGKQAEKVVRLEASA